MKRRNNQPHYVSWKDQAQRHSSRRIRTCRATAPGALMVLRYLSSPIIFSFFLSFCVCGLVRGAGISSSVLRSRQKEREEGTGNGFCRLINESGMILWTLSAAQSAGEGFSVDEEKTPSQHSHTHESSCTVTSTPGGILRQLLGFIIVSISLNYFSHASSKYGFRKASESDGGLRGIWNGFLESCASSDRFFFHIKSKF